MTYEESYMKCNSLEELRVEIVKDLSNACLINPDRIAIIKEKAEKVLNLKFNKELKNIIGGN